MSFLKPKLYNPTVNAIILQIPIEGSLLSQSRHMPNMVSSTRRIPSLFLLLIIDTSITHSNRRQLIFLLSLHLIVNFQCAAVPRWSIDVILRNPFLLICPVDFVHPFSNQTG